jgi:glycosyltransferase involved in cell wall biosynthesis
VHIVPHGVSDISDSETKLNSVQRPNILYVGGRWGYKNFKQLAGAMEILWEKGVDIQLNTIGHKFSSEEVEEYFKPKFRRYWKNYENVSDIELLEFYSRATMLIMTSKDEGFGLPILEAYSQGTHVLASDIPIFREVCGPLGRFFELGNTESLVEAIKQALDQALDFKLIGNRLLWAAKFSWIDAAKKKALVYKKFA